MMTDADNMDDNCADEASDAPATDAAAEAWKQWEAEDTSPGDRTRAKGSLIALLVVFLLLLAAVIVATLGEDSPLPAAWEKPAGAEVLDRQVKTVDGHMLEYYRLTWAGDPQAVLTEVLDMIKDAPVRQPLTGETATAAIDETVIAHRKDELPGKDIAMPVETNGGIYYSYTRQTEPPGPPADYRPPRRDIYVWQQNGVCLVEIFSY